MPFPALLTVLPAVQTSYAVKIKSTLPFLFPVSTYVRASVAFGEQSLKLTLVFFDLAQGIPGPLRILFPPNVRTDHGP